MTTSSAGRATSGRSPAGARPRRPPRPSPRPCRCGRAPSPCPAGRRPRPASWPTSAAAPRPASGRSRPRSTPPSSSGAQVALGSDPTEVVEALTRPHGRPGRAGALRGGRRLARPPQRPAARRRHGHHQRRPRADPPDRRRPAHRRPRLGGARHPPRPAGRGRGDPRRGRPDRSAGGDPRWPREEVAVPIRPTTAALPEETQILARWLFSPGVRLVNHDGPPLALPLRGRGLAPRRLRGGPSRPGPGPGPASAQPERSPRSAAATPALGDSTVARRGRRR